MGLHATRLLPDPPSSAALHIEPFIAPIYVIEVTGERFYISAEQLLAIQAWVEPRTLELQAQARAARTFMGKEYHGER